MVGMWVRCGDGVVVLFWAGNMGRLWCWCGVVAVLCVLLWGVMVLVAFVDVVVLVWKRAKIVVGCHVVLAWFCGGNHCDGL